MADSTYAPKVYRKQGGNEQVIASGGALTIESGGTFSLPGDMGKGFIPLPLSDARELSSNATINAAGNGGLLASDTTPVFQRVNGATDKALRLNWAASNVDEIAWSFAYPPDLDDAQPLEVHFLAAMAGASDTPVLGVAYFEGVGDTNAGGNTAAVTGTSVAEYSVSIAASDIGAAPNFASVSVVPAAHGTDILYVYAAWIEYSRKTTA